MGGIFLTPLPPPDVSRVRISGHLSGPAHRQHTKRRGWRSLGEGISHSGLRQNPREAPEMLPTASKGSRFANRSCNNSGRPAYLSGLLGNTQQVWPPGLGMTAPRRRTREATCRSGAEPEPQAIPMPQAHPTSQARELTQGSARVRTARVKSLH